MSGLTYGSLFSGYGGLDLAVEDVLGATCLWHSEVDPHASKVLAHHWPHAPNLGDITAITWEDVPPVDIIAGGFPCQDISSAGRGAGIKEGTRSGLWHRYADAVRVLRPRLVVVENVSALLVRGFDIVVGNLAALGYDVSWGSVRASDAGAPHRRERIFLAAVDADQRRHGGWAGESATEGRGEGRVGWPAGAGEDAATDADDGAEYGQRARPAPGRRGAGVATDASNIGHERERHPRDGRPGPAHDDRPTPDADGRGLVGVAAASGPGSGRLRASVAGHPAPVGWGAFLPAITRWETTLGRPAPHPAPDGRLNPAFVEWMMGLPAGWVTGNGLSRTAELRMLGNGVVPQQAAAALPLLLDADREAVPA